MLEAGLGRMRGNLHSCRPPLARLAHRQPWAALACTVALLSCAAVSVSAQNVQTFHPALGDAGFLGLDGTRTPGMLRGSANLFLDMAFDPVRLRTPALPGTPVEQRLMLHLGLELGLWGRGAIALRVPMIAYQHGQLAGRPADVFAATDPQLVARYRLLGASMADRDEPHDGPGLALQGAVAFPFGKGARASANGVMLAAPAANYPFASDDSIRTDLSVVGDFQLLGAGIGGSLGWRHHFWDSNSMQAASTSVNDELTFGAALKLPVPPLPKLSGVLELRGASGFRALRDTPLELDLGARVALGDFVIVLGGGIGLTHGLGAPAGRLFLGLYGVLPETDEDRDGVDDADDACPFLAEDRDGFQDGDGCPDPDNDNDLVPDLDDKCPSSAAEEGRDDDEDGCTDAAVGSPPAAAAGTQ
jgi:OOP family OmpA-OmpF porin